MENFHQRICNSQKALLAHVHHVQSLFLNGFEKLVSLNVHTVRSHLDNAANQTRSSSAQSGFLDPLAQFTDRIQHQFDRNIAYGNRLGEIFEDLQSGLRELTLTELGQIRHTTAVVPSPVHPAAKDSTRQYAKPAVQKKQSNAKPAAAAARNSGSAPPAPKQGRKAAHAQETGKGRQKSLAAVPSAKANAAKTSSGKPSSDVKHQAAPQPHSKPRAAGKLGKKRPLVTVTAASAAKKATPAVQPAASTTPAVARQPAAKPVAPVVPPRQAIAVAAHKSAPTADGQTAGTVRQATAVSEVSKRAPVVAPPVQAAAQQQASAPVAPAAVSATAQPPVSVISHLVAQTTPVDPKKDSTKS